MVSARMWAVRVADSKAKFASLEVVREPQKRSSPLIRTRVVTLAAFSTLASQSGS